MINSITYSQSTLNPSILCPVCFEQMSHDEEIVGHPLNRESDLQHLVHKVCIKNWVQNFSFCPVPSCGANIDLRSLLSLNERIIRQINICAPDFVNGLRDGARVGAIYCFVFFILLEISR